MRYRLFGLTVDSEFSLPLLPDVSRKPTDVKITLGQVEPGPDVVWRQQLPIAFSCTRDNQQIILSWPTMRFAVSPNRIVVAADDLELAAISLFQSSWSVLLTARGREALHASVVARDGRAVAVAGASGSGKSTAALALLDSGWSLVSDDILTFDDAGNALPGAPFVRLRPDRALGRAGELDVAGKLRFRPSLCVEPQPISAIFIHDDAHTEIRRLVGASAVGALLSNVYNDVITHQGQAMRRFEISMKLADEVPIFGIPPRSLTATQLETMANDIIATT